MSTKLVRLTRDIAVNPEHVATVYWDRGYSYTKLVVRMHDGFEHHIRHEGSVDCYQIEKDLLNA